MCKPYGYVLSPRRIHLPWWCESIIHLSQSRVHVEGLHLACESALQTQCEPPSTSSTPSLLIVDTVGPYLVFRELWGTAVIFAPTPLPFWPQPSLSKGCWSLLGSCACVCVWVRARVCVLACGEEWGFLCPHRHIYCETRISSLCNLQGSEFL